MLIRAYEEVLLRYSWSGMLPRRQPSDRSMREVIRQLVLSDSRGGPFGDCGREANTWLPSVIKKSSSDRFCRSLRSRLGG